MLDKGDESNILIKIYHLMIFLILAFVWFNEREKGILMEEKWKEKKLCILIKYVGGGWAGLGIYVEVSVFGLGGRVSNEFYCITGWIGLGGCMVASVWFYEKFFL